MKGIICSPQEVNVKRYSTDELVSKLREAISGSISAPVAFANKVSEIGGTCLSGRMQDDATDDSGD